MAKSERKIKSEGKGRKVGANVTRINEWKVFAYTMILAVFALAFNREYFVNVYQDFPDKWKSSSPTEMAIFIAPIVLFIELAVLVIRWIIATADGFELWEQWLDHPDVKAKINTVFIGLALILGILPAFPNHIVFTSGFMAFYSIVNLVAQQLCNVHFRRALQETRKKPVDKDKKEVLSAMEHFWLKRPQLTRIAIVTLFCFVAFCLALAGTMQQEAWRHYFQLSSYAVLILVLFVSEIIIAWWRFKLGQVTQKFIVTAGKDSQDATHAR